MAVVERVHWAHQEGLFLNRGINLLLINTIGGGNYHFRSFIAPFYSVPVCSDISTLGLFVTLYIFLVFLAIFSGLARNHVLEPISSFLGIDFVSISHTTFMYDYNISYIDIDIIFIAFWHSIQLQQLMCLLIWSLEACSYCLSGLILNIFCIFLLIY